jgi:biotin transport system substrate-specific component
MSHPSAAIPRPLVLGDLLSGTRARDAALVLGGAGLTALGAQITVHTAASPVPITGQTLGVVIAGAALGARRGALSQLVYLLLGFLLPVYADGASGTGVLWGASGGYLVGFVVAAGLIGWLAEHGADRRPLLAALAFALAQLAVFAVGVPWLKVVAHMDWGTAIHAGFTVFIVGGIVKAVIAGIVTPSAWRLAHREHR